MRLLPPAPPPPPPPPAPLESCVVLRLMSPLLEDCGDDSLLTETEWSRELADERSSFPELVYASMIRSIPDGWIDSKDLLLLLLPSGLAHRLNSSIVSVLI